MTAWMAPVSVLLPPPSAPSTSVAVAADEGYSCVNVCNIFFFITGSNESNMALVCD